MITAQEVLNDHYTFAFMKVPDVIPSELPLLALHPDSAVRVAALHLIKDSQVPVFIGDPNPRVQEMVARRCSKAL